MVGEASVTDFGEVEDTLWPVVATHLADSPAEAFVRDAAGRVDLLLVDFLGAEIKAALLTLVSGDAIATCAIANVSSPVCVQPSASTHQNGPPATRQEEHIVVGF